MVEGSICETGTLKNRIVNIIDKNFLFRNGSIGGLFWLVKKFFASILRRKAGAGDAIGGGRWVGGRCFEKSSHSPIRSRNGFWSSHPVRSRF